MEQCQFRGAFRTAAFQSLIMGQETGARDAAGLDAAALARLRCLARGFEVTPQGSVYTLDLDLPLSVLERAGAEILMYQNRCGPEGAARPMPVLSQILVRAASWVRAQGEVTPNAVRAGLRRADVITESRDMSYANFFAVEERRLRFPKYGGGQSETVLRAGFVMGDAVTVVPYDPVRDRVLVVEQFRFGVFLRGDPNPWALEPIAGRVDPGESTETAVRREAMEEAGVTLGALEPVGNYYPSPGGITEYLYTYVGLADLPDGSAKIAGLEQEAEDIRGVLLGFDALMEAVQSGEIQTGPLLLTAYWLLAHRDRLRAGSGGG